MKTPKDMKEFRQQAASLLREGKPLLGKDGIFTPMVKQVLEAALEGEMDAHMENKPPGAGNRRNGTSTKTVKSSSGNFQIDTPRDRSGTFQPQTIEKRQTFLPGDLEDKILGLYGLGMSYRDIQSHLLEMYGTTVSDGVLNSITDRIIPALKEWQSRPLDGLYTIVWMDAIHFKVRQDGRVITKAVYSILGVDEQGNKQVLGLYLGTNESATFWMQVLTDMQERGIEDILIACVDNLSGFVEAIETIFPKTEVQLCVIHQIRNSLKFIPSKNQRAFVADLKLVYKASSLEMAENQLDKLDEKWGKQYPGVIKSWRSNWTNLTQYFKYPSQIRRLIYTTNTVEGYHRMVRKVTKSKGAFTSDMAVMKLVYLATININKKWKRPLREWPAIYNQLYIYFEERIKPSTS